MRRLLPLLRSLILLAVLVLAACATNGTSTQGESSPSPAPPPPAPVTLTVWHSWSGARLDALNSLARSFEQANPDTRIRLESQPITDIVGNYSRSVADGAAPQLLVALGRYVGDLAERQAIAPLDESSLEDALSQLAPAALASGRVGDQLYGLPVAYDGLVLFYDRRRVGEAPATFEDVVALNGALRDETPETRPWSLGYYLSLETTLPYLSASGGTLLDDDGRPSFAGQSRDATQRWLEWLKSLQADPDVIASYDYSVVDAAIQEGRVWSAIDWSHRRTAYAQIWGADAVGIAPLPTLDADSTPRALILPELLCVNPVAPAEQRAAAESFARYLIDGPAQETLWSRGGMLPAHQSVALSDDAAPLRLALSQTEALPGGVTATAIWRPLNDMFRSVVSNAVPIPEAVDAAGATLQRVLP
jgi:ABC-type glycerol-3-phosphate transport system substrate-binding protein